MYRRLAQREADWCNIYTRALSVKTPKAERPERPCEVCGRAMTYLSTMNRIGLLPKIAVYRCDHCRRIEVEEE